jgi:methylthioribose-1-phosphate isomerase
MAEMTQSSAHLSVRFEENRLVALDQRRLPHEVIYLTLTDAAGVRDAIVSMAIRGAPLIGIAAAYGVVLAAKSGVSDIAGAITMLAASRPTAVNLRWALDRMSRVLRAGGGASELQAEAHAIFREDRETNLAIARAGTAVLPKGARVIHHCNTGSLATSDYGTALGVLRYAHEQGNPIHVYLDETRPRFQGAALSAFELRHFGVPHTLIIDSAAAYLMRTRRIDACIVGCDRVARNGDTANKIGTLGLATVARAYGVPFYVACPLSSIDLSLDCGDGIPIEERSADEIRTIAGSLICPEGTPVWNPAFDVTPGELITGFITPSGLVGPPYAHTIPALFSA